MLGMPAGQAGVEQYTKHLASLVGSYYRELLNEDFLPEEAFQLVNHFQSQTVHEAIRASKEEEEEKEDEGE